MRITRLFALLALAALLAPRIEASRSSVWESNPLASMTATKSDAAGLLASLAPDAAADIEAEEPPVFNLGDVVPVERELVHEERFHLGPLTLVDLNLLRGPPPSYPETRVGGFELLPLFRVGASPSLSLWGHQACGFSCREVASDSRYDPWGLESGGTFGAIDRRDRGITNPIAGTIDPEAVAREAAATAVEELSYVGIANGLSSSLLGYDFVRNEKVKGPIARVLAAVSVVPGIPATVRKIDELPWLKGVARHGLPEVGDAIRIGPERQLSAVTRSAVRRGAEGVAFARNLPVVREGQQWLRGTGRDAGRVPGQIAERLSGRKFGSFDDFRRAFWTEVSQDAALSKQFGPNSLREMQAGRAPFAPGAGQAGERIKYELDHLMEIQAGGAVYDMNNLVIRTPVNHIGK